MNRQVLTPDESTRYKLTTTPENGAAYVEEYLSRYKNSQSIYGRDPILLDDLRALLSGYEAAVKEIESMLMDTCDRSRCVNMKCHLDQASCSPKWRGPNPAGEAQP